MSPAARLVMEGCQGGLQEMIVAEGLDLEHLACNGLMEPPLKSQEEEQEGEATPSNQDKLDVRSHLLHLLLRLDGSRPLGRDELDDYMKTIGRRKIKRPGVVLQCFRMAAKLAELGVRTLAFLSDRVLRQNR